jgi:hypothetical protein
MTKTNKQLYEQNGGLGLMILAKIGEFLLMIVMAVLKFIWALIKVLFAFSFNFKEHPFTLGVHLKDSQGYAYKYIGLAIKSGFYLVIFAFGGPLLTLVGISLLYKSLFGKFKELQKDEDDVNSSNSDNSNNLN